MKKKYLLAYMAIIFTLMVAGCGNGGSDQPPDYVGVFKSVRSSTDKTVIITITKDDGTLYEGTIDKLPVKGTWGQSESDSLGLITNQLNKGYDTYFIAGSGVTGTAYRQ
jgi:hypothetical protein